MISDFSDPRFRTLFAAQAAMICVNFCITILAARSFVLAGGATALATLPFAIIHLSSLLCVVLTDHLIERFGVRRFVQTGALCGVAGIGLLACGPFLQASSTMLLGFGLTGWAVGTSFIYRFEAVRGVEAERRTARLSWMTASGLIAAVIAPLATLPAAAEDVSGFTLALAATAAIQFLSFGILLRLPDVKHHSRTAQPQAIQGISTFLLPLLVGSCAFGTMSMLMALTPPVMTDRGLHPQDISLVFFSHILAMYTPGLFAAGLSKYLNAPRLIYLGFALNGVALMVAWKATFFGNFLFLMILNGAGWAFMSIGASAIIASSTSYSKSLYNATAIVSSAGAALFAGWLLDMTNWQSILLVTGLWLVCTALYMSLCRLRSDGSGLLR